MSQQTVNPYPDIGQYYSQGLAYIIANVVAPVSIEDLVAQVYAYWVSVYSKTGTPSVQLQEELNSIAYTGINSYINGLVPSGKSALSPRTMGFVNMLICPKVMQNVPIYLTNWIGDVEDNISKAGLTVDEQRPLLMATEIGPAAYTYWKGETAKEAGSSWASYFILNNNDYNSLPAWVAASMEGALAGYAANMQGLNEPTINKETNTMWAALIGALTIAAGKVVFGWIPRIQPEVGSFTVQRDDTGGWSCSCADGTTGGPFYTKSEAKSWGNAHCTSGIFTISYSINKASLNIPFVTACES